MPAISIVLCGVGGVGRNLTRLLRARPDCRIVGALSRNPSFVGMDIGELADGEPIGVAVTDDPEMVFKEAADLMVVATTSFLSDVKNDILAGIRRGLNVITTAEEAVYPWITDPVCADELDALARDQGVSVIGVGLNPGFIFDTLLLTVSSIAWDVEAIRVRRVVDISSFSATVQRRLGIGFSAELFASGVRAGRITGHIGFPQSFHIVAKCLGKEITRIQSSFEPLIADRTYSQGQLTVMPGTTAGFVQHYQAICGRRPWISAEFIAHVDPNTDGYEPADSINIDGHNPLSLLIRPGCNPQLGSAAMISNVIPRLIGARPGYLTVADLSLPHACITTGSFS